MASTAEEIYRNWNGLNSTGRPKEEFFTDTRYVYCYYCGEWAQVPKQCGACKAIIYCSPECQEQSWKVSYTKGVAGAGPRHKQVCKENRKQMERCPAFDEVRAYFPWAYLAKNGNIPLEYILADRGLLGSIGFGYWSGLGREFAVIPEEGFVDGHALLSPSFLDEKEEWHGIPDEHIPWRDFSNGKPMPTKMETGRILHSWKDWHEWRGIPNESPAALIMNNVMSIYYMLTSCLDYKPLAPSSSRKELNFHLLGPEIELNMLPTLSELALLLPGYDLKFTLIGPAVQSLTQKARWDNPDSLAAKDGPLFTYSAPVELGSSTISITLHKKSPLYTEQVLPNIGVPHAFLSLRAGISKAQGDWWPVVRDALYFDIPFLSTEDLEMSLHTFSIPVINRMFDTAKEHCATLIPDPMQRFKFMLKTPLREQNTLATVKVNPFHSPGNTMGHTRLPSCRNGFVLVVRDDRAESSRAVASMR